MRSTGWTAVPGSGPRGRGSGPGRGRRAAASVAAIALVSAALFGGAAAASAAPPRVAGPGSPRRPGDVDHGSQAGGRHLHDHGVQGLVHPLGGHAGGGLLPAGRRGEQPQPRIHRHRRLDVHRPRVAGHDPRGEPRRPAGAACTRRSTPTRTAGTRSSRPRSPIPPASSVIIERLGPLARRRHVSRCSPSTTRRWRTAAGTTRPGSGAARSSPRTSPVIRAPAPSPSPAPSSPTRTSWRPRNGFAGVSDGWTDLAADHRPRPPLRAGARRQRRADRRAEAHRPGEGRVRDPRARIRGIRRRCAHDRQREPRQGRQGRRRGRRRVRRRLARLPRQRQRRPRRAWPAMRELTTQYNVAAMTLKAHEDKTYRGANIASLTIPWGQAQNANEAGVGGYHLVWARDLYQVSTAQIALGDSDAANRSLDYLFDVQQKSDGSFPQNSLLDGTPYWGGLQLDEVAFPIVLAWALGRTDATTYAEHVKTAADFLVGHGPSTPQERWEEEGGYSPSTIAAEIAGLTAAASIAETNGDEASAAIYTGVADDWQRKVQGVDVHHHRPARQRPVLRAHRRQRRTRTTATRSTSTTAAAPGTSARSSTPASSTSCASASSPPRMPRSSNRSPRSTRRSRSTRRTVRSGTATTTTATARRPTGRPTTAPASGRLWPLLSGERGEYELANGRTATDVPRHAGGNRERRAT